MNTAPPIPVNTDNPINAKILATCHLDVERHGRMIAPRVAAGLNEGADFSGRSP